MFFPKSECLRGTVLMCFEGIVLDPVFMGVAGISAVAAFVMLWMLKFQSFQGKKYYALTFVAMIWTLMMVGSEAASSSFSCQFQWATLAWLGNALVPIAWCFFVFAYVENASWLNTRSVNAALVVTPLAIFAFAATNQWHNLVYTEASIIPPGEENIDYAHGPGFYLIIATLYTFVLATLFCLAKAFTRARRATWPLLTMLVVITITPLTANAAYVVLNFTVFGLDPTAFMFTLGIVAFTWLLATNKTMDMAAVGRSILFNTMSEPVVLIDRHRKVSLMNTAAKRSDLLHGTGRLPSEMLTTIERWNTRGDAGHLIVGGRAYEPRLQNIENPLDPSGSVLGWSITFVDITDRIATSAALEKALQRADEASRAKDEFVAVISHELRTPLTSLKGGLAIALSDRCGDLPTPIRSALEIANRNAGRLSRLVDNILMAQKIDIEAMALEQEQVDLGTLLEESIVENRMFASARGVTLTTGQIDHPVNIAGDAFAIRQIIDNLISNAIKFSNDHGVVEGAIKIEDGRIRLSIKDNGQGIPEGREGQVFGRFEQVEGGGQRHTQGSGLGLHISKNLATQMAGSLYYESQVGLGTTFYLEFSLTDQHTRETVNL